MNETHFADRARICEASTCRSSSAFSVRLTSQQVASFCSRPVAGLLYGIAPGWGPCSSGDRAAVTG
jgi:hypothetical protein